MNRFWLALLAATWLASAAMAAPPSLQPVGAPVGTLPLVDASGNPPPATLAGNATWTSACIAVPSYRAFTAFAALSGNAGTLTVPRYADVTTCAQPVGMGLSTDPSNALTLTNGGGCPSSSYCGNVSQNDGMPFAAVKVILTDTSGATNTIVKLSLVVGGE